MTADQLPSTVRPTLADAGSRLRLQMIGAGLRQVFDLKPGHGVLDCTELLRRIDQAEP